MHRREVLGQMNYFFPHEVGVCAYIDAYHPMQVKRWIAWLGRRGVSLFYLYTTVNMPQLSQEVMDEILAGRVVIIKIGVPEGKSAIDEIYTDCLRRVCYTCKYLALFQPDEYLESSSELMINEIARKVFSPNVGAVEFSCTEGGVRYLVNTMLIKEMSGGRLKGVNGFRYRTVTGVTIGRKKIKYIAMISHVMARNGAPLALLSVAKILKEAGYEIDVYSIAKGPLEEEFAKLGIAVIVDPDLQRKALVDQPWYYAYDLFWVNTAVMLRCFQRPLREVPAIWWLHESSSIMKWCGISEEVLAGISGENVHIMAVSQVAKRDFEALAPNLRVEGILTLGVEDAFKGRTRIRKENEPFVFMMCGTLEKRKGQDIFLKAISLMKEENRKKCRFYLLGESGQSTEPGYEDEVNGLVAKYPEVEMMPFQPHEKILDMYGRVDAVVVPSREETLSIVAVEAMMMGVPCIVSDNIGVSGYIKDRESGVVFHNGDEKDLEEKMRFIIENHQEEKNISMAGRKLYENSFSSLAFRNNLLNIIEDVIDKRAIDIIVPIYNALNELELCLESLYKNTTINYNLYLINDGSTDYEIVKYLKSLEHKERPDNLRELNIIHNENNMGFVKTVNRGLSMSSNDVIILNTDTEVPYGWLERFIAAAQKDERIASITPFSNSATICSFPEMLKDNEMYMNKSLDEIDKAFRECDYSTPIDIPTAVGFCMYMKRKVIDDIGVFDEAFKEGYGEENDWCMRAYEKGYRNVCIANLFVFHKHGASFGKKLNEKRNDIMKRHLELVIKKHPQYMNMVREYVMRDPARRIRENICEIINKNSTLQILAK